LPCEGYTFIHESKERKMKLLAATVMWHLMMEESSASAIAIRTRTHQEEPYAA
jgi:hypothetical protein